MCHRRESRRQYRRKNCMRQWKKFRFYLFLDGIYPSESNSKAPRRKMQQLKHSFSKLFHWNGQLCILWSGCCVSRVTFQGPELAGLAAPWLQHPLGPDGQGQGNSPQKGSSLILQRNLLWLDLHGKTPQRTNCSCLGGRDDSACFKVSYDGRGGEVVGRERGGERERREREGGWEREGGGYIWPGWLVSGLSNAWHSIIVGTLMSMEGSLRVR